MSAISLTCAWTMGTSANGLFVMLLGAVAERRMLLTLMLVVFGCAHLRLKLAADLVEEVVEATGAIARGRGAHAAVGGIHRHVYGDEKVNRRGR